MSCFMFTSGVLVTRIPLTPIIILSFFCIYGTFDTNNNCSNFIIKHPWLITALHICIPLILFLICKHIHIAFEHEPGDMKIGEDILILIAAIPVIIAWLISLVIAFIKLYKFIATTPMAKYVLIVASCFFVIGLIIGVIEYYITFSSSFNLDDSWPYFLGFTILCILLCIYSVYGMTTVTPRLLILFLSLYIITSSTLAYLNPVLHDKKKLYT